MEVKVVKTRIYSVAEVSINKFKEKMLDYDEENTCTIEDIPDEIVRETIADAVQDAFENDYCYSGFEFNDYFGTVYLDFAEDDVSDCVYEAIDKWKAR